MLLMNAEDTGLCHHTCLGLEKVYMVIQDVPNKHCVSWIE